ncbi:MAG: hypothetical protein GWN01_11705 [Nitrosopumilaceae archaeon]|nr:hypothetical protein [Nitrosopumilaceae archaeon]NIU01541.1 hypothetical protein [Nitrosopumilaceae archaeon]NIU87960.1 hypothetical protein [Nitrosopumilaceae archaeon]NIV66232.1 hypothetical protein [Nitrosopumilaceae archaeon]NIX62143.1 hypothetical protein [Nitrosopumilaceae archaeon]
MSDTLNEQVKKIIDNFEASEPDDIVHTLEKIKDQFKINEVRDYLDGKIQDISKADKQKKKELCLKLKPYFDWYLQGI